MRRVMPDLVDPWTRASMGGLLELTGPPHGMARFRGYVVRFGEDGHVCTILTGRDWPEA